MTCFSVQVADDTVKDSCASLCLVIYISYKQHRSKLNPINYFVCSYESFPAMMSSLYFDEL